ncbi:MAG TPA: type II/IV secretion system ATPase subunit [Candidatus Woesearchaeota archaeon]|nr:type II/IV secretion system ATPase subunit [Candidatus Woesearchaeota archaeon]
MIERIIIAPDKIFDFVIDEYDKKKLGVSISQVSKSLLIEPKKVEFWAVFLEEQGILEINYPLNPFGSPILKPLKREIKDNKKPIPIVEKKELIYDYQLNSDGMDAHVKIWKVPNEDVSIYDLSVPKLSIGAEAFVNGMIELLLKNIPTEIEEATDPKKVEEIKKRYLKTVILEVRKRIPEEKEDIILCLASIIIHKIYGLGHIEVLLSDNNIEEIAINSSTEPISIYHKRAGWLKSHIFIDNEENIFNLSSDIGRRSGQQINSLHPIMDAYLLSGDRVASTLYPISTNGNTITIRRFARNPWTITQFVEKEINLFSKEVAAFIWLAMQYELNIIVAGGTASGKTSVLNVLSSFIPPTNRIISVEDTREISLPKSLRWNWVPMTSKNPNPEGEGEISMLDLIVAALRMRPDRILVGEIRRKEQAQALFEAMHTGHSVYATMHADTASQVLKRLEEPPLSVPKTEIGSLHLVIIQFRDRRSGRRKTLEVAEIIESKDDIELNHLFRWTPRTDNFEKVNPSRRIFEELSLHTGATPKEIEHDLKEKENILEWMAKNKIEDINDVGEIFRIYYKEKDFLIKGISQKLSFKEIIDLFQGKENKNNASAQKKSNLEQNTSKKNRAKHKK